MGPGGDLVTVILHAASSVLQIVAILTPWWVGELNAGMDFYSSIYYGVYCNNGTCDVRSHHATYLMAMRDDKTSAAVVDVWYYRVVKNQVASLVAVVFSLVTMAVFIHKRRKGIQHSKFESVASVVMAVTCTLQLETIAAMWIGYDFGNKLPAGNIFPYSLLLYVASWLLLGVTTAIVTVSVYTHYSAALAGQQYRRP